MFRLMIWVAIFFFLLLSCSTSQFGWKAKPESVEKKGTKGVLVEDFDPLSLNDDDIVILPTEKASGSETKEGTEMEKVTLDTEKPSGETVQGFRIQLLATKDEIQAREARKNAVFKFYEKVYLVFESPHYKLRIGDCTTKKEAEELKMKAIQNGFPDAWIVPSKVYPSKDE